MYTSFVSPVRVLFTSEDLSKVVALFDSLGVKLFNAKAIGSIYYMSYQDAMYPDLYYKLTACGFKCCKA